MKHKLSICVSKNQKTGGVVACQRKTVREKLLSWLLGSPQKLTVIVPGDTVEMVSITELPEGGDGREAV